MLEVSGGEWVEELVGELVQELDQSSLLYRNIPIRKIEDCSFFISYSVF